MGHAEELEVGDEATGLTFERVTWRSRRWTTRSRGSRSRGSLGKVGGRLGCHGAHVRGGHLEESEINDEATRLMLGHVEESEVDDEVTGLTFEGVMGRSRRWTTRSLGSRSRGSRGGVGGR
eukprot:2666669-Rhodomonas_salina.1